MDHGNRVDVGAITPLWFGPGDPVRAASAIAPLGDGWLIAQDDATHAAWWRPHADPADRIHRIRTHPTREGLEAFDDASGTKHLKPDVEAACAVQVAGRACVLLLGSGALPARAEASLVMAEDLDVLTADLTPLYGRIRRALALEEGQLNLEGACVIDPHEAGGEATAARLRWYQRGHGRSGVPSAWVDVDLADLLCVLRGDVDAADPAILGSGRLELGDLDGMPLTITDAVRLPDGRVCASATAEDAPDAVADGPVTGSVLVLLEDGGSTTTVPLPPPVSVAKVEGLAVTGVDGHRVGLLAVVDADDPHVPSLAVTLTLDLA